MLPEARFNQSLLRSELTISVYSNKPVYYAPAAHALCAPQGCMLSADLSFTEEAACMT